MDAGGDVVCGDVMGDGGDAVGDGVVWWRGGGCDGVMVVAVVA
jgi:hypothetical protein